MDQEQKSIFLGTGGNLVSEESLEKLKESLSIFASERNWEKYHTPKNLAMALAREVGELLAEFQWMSNDESLNAMDSDSAEQIRNEIADVFIYLVRLADILDINLISAANNKIVLNANKYPSPDLS